jgi:hypothetical protein
MDCFSHTVVVGCFNGSQPVAIHYTHDEQGQPAVRYLNNIGQVVIGANSGNVTIGACVLPDIQYSIISGGINIAGPDRAATAAFTGATDLWDSSSVPDFLHSVTFSARSVEDGMPGNTLHQIIIDMPDGSKLSMKNGETRTFSVERVQDRELKRDYRVTATGLAYANITYTFYS